jgi:hypothetical protein
LLACEYKITLTDIISITADNIRKLNSELLIFI